MLSCIMFDSSHMGDTWDWLESILIMRDYERWHDLSFGHTHLRRLLLDMQPLCLTYYIEEYPFQPVMHSWDDNLHWDMLIL